MKKLISKLQALTVNELNKIKGGDGEDELAPIPPEKQGQGAY